MIQGDNIHELTAAENDSTDDVRHEKPNDRHSRLVWIWEPAKATGVLTQDGITQIAYHKYVAGTYTFLDTALNTTWQSLTNLLPMSMAPNMVTTIGGLHCVAAYLITWSYTSNWQNDVPSWVLALNGYCCMVYYTLDCMDGKQARRTGTSSPLGQLFDHGMDCLCLQEHNSMCMAWLSLGTTDAVWFWGSQAALQFSFFMAQWEEYYTGVLPHATGNIGVTEVNYGLAVASLLNAILIPDRRAFYSQPVASLVPESVIDALPLEMIGMDAETFQLKHALLTGWYFMVTLLCILSLGRVIPNCRSAKERVAALSKLISPALICAAPFWVSPPVLSRDLRWFSLAYGTAMTQITIKLIVYSMAKQAYAAIQGKEVIPLTIACWWIRTDPRWKDPGICLLLQILTALYCLRIVRWTSEAIQQICDRLDIYLFTIKPKGETSKKKD